MGGDLSGEVAAVGGVVEEVGDGVGVVDGEVELLADGFARKLESAAAESAGLSMA